MDHKKYYILSKTGYSGQLLIDLALKELTNFNCSNFYPVIINNSSEDVLDGDKIIVDCMLSIPEGWTSENEFTRNQVVEYCKTTRK